MIKKRVFIVTFICMYLIICHSFVSQSEIVVSDNYFMINTEGERLGSVLDELAKQTGITFIFKESFENEIVTINRHYNDIEEGIKHLLKSYNTYFIYKDNGSIDKISILTSKSSVSPNRTSTNLHDKSLPETFIPTASVTSEINEIKKIDRSSIQLDSNSVDMILIDPSIDTYEISMDEEDMIELDPETGLEIN